MTGNGILNAERVCFEAFVKWLNYYQTLPMCIAHFEHPEGYNKSITPFDFSMRYEGDFDDASPIKLDDSMMTVLWGESRFDVKDAQIFLFETTYGSGHFLHIHAPFYAMPNGVRFNTALMDLDIHLKDAQAVKDYLYGRSLPEPQISYLSKQEREFFI